MTLLSYRDSRNIKPRRIPLTSLEGRKEAAFYDLIFNEVPLRKVAKETGLSYQGVYIRALAYMQLWNKQGLITFDTEHLEELKELYEGSAISPTA